ncbi:hypothetical protein ES319_A13G022800v1 [Gossypium barbadense]|uniref:Prolamin-like domain-containing protein n=3 Tax=Gossypium TaxID=3633 RepID=A0A5J5SUB0_GOSBA|nr:hypothetical protein ES319_A13G022800v1 [Gossypium barbadense]TYG85032.1 hypothetical protein ES288_A13G020600v1 [Gossypium darwinii]TYH90034.1 hypothetical protein ES332_A13G023700v1 [Gossypium tomentosum]
MSISRKSLLMFLNLAFMAMFVTAGNVRQLLPPFPFAPTPGLAPFQLGAVQNCWSSLTNIQGCMTAISDSFFFGQIGAIGSACCQAITHISDDCWSKMFPFNPFFPPFLRIFCSSPTPHARPILNGISEVLPQLSSRSEVEKCWSSLSNVNGCIMEILKSLSGGTMPSPTCCNAIIKLNDDCWPKLFPFNPLFPPLLKNYCSGTAATPK